MTRTSEKWINGHSGTLNSTIIWIFLSTWFSGGAVLLSFFGLLDRKCVGMLLFAGIAGSIYGHYRLNGNRWTSSGWRWRRFKKPFPLLYLLCAIAALLGGALHAPTNFDALSYRIPRLLHWLSAERWHWIGGMDPRMDFSAAGFELLMLPVFATFHTLRFAFLNNVISYFLLPGLIFSVFSALGVKRSVAATWMWILPCASCFVMEAGSIGNDLIASVYLLAALLFTLRAIQNGKHIDVILAVLSAALMTGAKASNLPLLLPISICMTALFYKRPRLFVTASLAGGLAFLVSFAPLAIVNQRHTGDWTGDPGNLLKLNNPTAGIAGNVLLLTGASFAPALFPPADKINQWFNTRTVQPPLKWIKKNFADFRMTLPQIASEEHSGLGLGVSIAILAGLAGSARQLRLTGISTLGTAVGLGFWGALLFYMMKLGNCGAPRLIAPYYVGLIALPLLLIQSGKVFTRPWWRWISLIALAPIIPALLMNPARPLLPMSSIIGTLKSRGITSATLQRMETVYAVYAERSDAQEAVRKLLPVTASSIGFAGTSDESEYSFWLPLGTKKVRDFKPVPHRDLPDASDLDAIVTSDWGCDDRFKMTPEQLAQAMAWQIVGTTRVRTYASGDEVRWSVLVPKPAP
jgi:hypothetical protein